MEGNIYPTREEADYVRQDIIKFNDFVNDQDYESIKLKDMNVYKTCLEKVQEIDFLSVQFKTKCQDRLKEYLAPILIQQFFEERLSEKESFMREFRKMIEQTRFYKSDGSRFRFYGFEAENNKVPKKDHLDGIPLLYQDFSLIFRWNDGIILTSKILATYHKANIVDSIFLKDIGLVEVMNNGIRVCDKEGEKVIEVPSIPIKKTDNLLEEYVNILNILVKALVRLPFEVDSI